MKLRLSGLQGKHFTYWAVSPAPKLRLLLSHSLTRKQIFAKYLWLPKTYKEASPIGDFLDVFPSEGWEFTYLVNMLTKIKFKFHSFTNLRQKYSKPQTLGKMGWGGNKNPFDFKS